MRRPWGLPADLFTDWSLRELEACRQRVAVEAPHELRRHPEATRHVWLAAYAHLRGRAVTDTLVDLLIETVHHRPGRAQGAGAAGRPQACRRQAEPPVRPGRRRRRETGRHRPRGAVPRGGRTNAP